MKNKLIFVSTIVLILLLVGGTSMAWFTSQEKAENIFTAGTIKVEVVEPGFKNLTNVEAGTYDKNVKVKSLGSKKTYVRVRLIPQWSDPSLPVSNVTLNLGGNSNWILHTDGHYYFKHYLTQGQITNSLLASVTFTELGEEYSGKTFTVKVVAEGVQTTNDMWKDKWGLTTLPFTPDQPWTPNP